MQVIRAVDPDLAKKKRVAVRNMELVRTVILMMMMMHTCPGDLSTSM